jgi:hypothetical protein
MSTKLASVNPKAGALQRFASAFRRRRLDGGQFVQARDGEDANQKGVDEELDLVSVIEQHIDRGDVHELHCADVYREFPAAVGSFGDGGG